MPPTADIHRPFGNTGLRLPPIVFGTATLGNRGRVPSDLAKLEMVSRWFDEVRPPVVVDTAGKWGAGLAIESTGRALAKLEIRPDEIVIMARLGWRRMPLLAAEPSFEPGVWVDIGHDAETRIGYDGILECWAEACGLLGGAYRPQLVSVDEPDRYLAGATSPDDRHRRWDDILDAYRALAELKQRGDIRGIGVGGHDWRVVGEIAGLVHPDWVLLDGCYTLLNHPPELAALMQELSSRQIPLVVGGVMHSGFLSGGKLFNGRQLDPTETADRSLLAWRKSFVTLCEAHGLSPARACIQFALAGPGVAAVTLNAPNADRIAQDVADVANPIPDSLWESMIEEGLLSAPRERD